MNYPKFGMVGYGLITAGTGIEVTIDVGLRLSGHPSPTIFLLLFPLLTFVGLVFAAATWISMSRQERRSFFLVVGVLIVAQIPLSIPFGFLAPGNLSPIQALVNIVEILIAIAFLLAGRLRRIQYLNYAGIATVLSVIASILAPNLVVYVIELFPNVFAFVGFMKLDKLLKIPTEGNILPMTNG